MRLALGKVLSSALHIALHFAAPSSQRPSEVCLFALGSTPVCIMSHLFYITIDPSSSLAIDNHHPDLMKSVLMSLRPKARVCRNMT